MIRQEGENSYWVKNLVTENQSKLHITDLKKDIGDSYYLDKIMKEVQTIIKASRQNDAGKQEGSMARSESEERENRQMDEEKPAEREGSTKKKR